jgi:hypothetical protein
MCQHGACDRDAAVIVEIDGEDVAVCEQHAEGRETFPIG